MTTITTTTTDNGANNTVDPKVLAMINQTVQSALAASGPKPGQKTAQQMADEAAAASIKANLTARILRDVESDASVRVGLRTCMDQGIIAGAALTAIGQTEMGARLSAQGEQARLAQRKALSAQGATGTVRSALSYVPFVGDVFLGGDSISERALYAQQNAAYAQKQAAADVAQMIAPVAGAIHAALTANTEMAKAKVAETQARTVATFGTIAKGLCDAQEAARGTQASLDKATEKKAESEAAYNGALGHLNTLKSANAPKADIEAAEKVVQGKKAAHVSMEQSYDRALAAHTEARAVIKAFGG